ncbi:MAG: DUF421 domain-containing protein [Verrucomicrobiota bacterium]|nr:DUF421 domain-containing protein [Verrucomicrobiota bacterium]
MGETNFAPRSVSSTRDRRIRPRTRHHGSASFFPTLGGALGKGVPESIVENVERKRDVMFRNHISDHDLEENLRLSAHVEDLSKIRAARIERSGDISFIKKQDA